MKKIINTLLSIPKRLIEFFNQVFIELRKVEWFSRRKTFKYTLIVVILIVVGVVFILALDRLFLAARNLII